jgi:hypothetical protein
VLTRLPFSYLSFARVSTRCNTMFQDPTFPVEPSNLSVNDTQSTSVRSGSFVFDGTRFAAKPGRKRCNNLKKSTRSPMAHMEFIHTLHSPTMEWTQEPRMPSFAQGGLMTPQTPQTPSYFDQRPFTTRFLEGYDYIKPLSFSNGILIHST